MPLLATFLGAGSSPRARGTQYIDLLLTKVPRFIPASAGNTGREQTPIGWCPVHPRERGEHLTSSAPVLSSVGSSPRARGTPTISRAQNESARFIPASAGNTTTIASRMMPPSVHPRERGEHGFMHCHAPSTGGSSPRARGTPEARANGIKSARFIPASAGNTSTTGLMRSASTVHPRERGEHPNRLVIPFCAAGSSPRARGTHDRWHRTS